MSNHKLIRFKDDEYTDRAIDTLCAMLDATRKDKCTIDWVLFYEMDQDMLMCMKQFIGQKNIKLFNMTVEEIIDVE